jgi:hypothetical protein
MYFIQRLCYNKILNFLKNIIFHNKIHILISKHPKKSKVKVNNKVNVKSSNSKCNGVEVKGEKITIYFTNDSFLAVGGFFFWGF